MMMTTSHSNALDYDNLSPGTVLFNHYRILRCLGKGSTSNVYSCTLLDEYQLVAALKILSSTAAKDPLITARFRNEMRAAEGIHHAHVIDYIDFVKDQHCEALVIELAEGGSLHDLLFRKAKLPLAQSLRILSQLCLGLQAMHDAGVVHRDLKPKNILLTQQQNVKISDFNTALRLNSKASLGDVGIVGTSDYISPEVLLSGVAGPRSDIFALGVIAYQMITGQLPFKRESFAGEQRYKSQAPPPPPNQLRPDCPPALSTLVMHALAEKPAKRTPTARHFYDELQRVGPRQSQESACKGFFSRFGKGK